MDEFRFNLNLWQKAFVYEPPVIPPDADIRLIVDPSYTSEIAGNGRTRASDCSGLIVTFKSDREDGGRDLNVLDGSCDRFKGILLPDEIVRLAGLWNPSRIRIERQGPGAYDLLADVILLRAAEKGISINSIESFKPDNRNRAKPNRIRKIQTDLLESDSPALKIYCPALFPIIRAQVEKFAFESDNNFEREDSILDCIALSAFRGEL